MGKTLLDQPRNEHLLPLEPLGLMDGAEHENFARLIVDGRVHAVDVAGQQQIGDQPFEAVVLGGQERELFDVGNAVVRPLIFEPHGRRIAALQDGPDRSRGIAIGFGCAKLSQVGDEPGKKSLASGGSKRHDLG